MKPLASIKNVLFISMGGIGNCILLTPAIKAVAEIAPLAHLHFLFPKNGARDIVEFHPAIGSLFETDLKVKNIPSLIMRMRRIHPDLVIAAHGTNPLKAGLIGLLCGGKIRLGEAFGAGKIVYNRTIPFDNSLHEGEANLTIVRTFAPVDTKMKPEVWTTEADRCSACHFIYEHKLKNQCWIGIHLGSGPLMSYKRWPTDRFIAVARQLIKSFNCSIVLFGGENEAALCDDALTRIGKKYTVSAAGKLSIRESFEVMKKAALFISNDSGPMHLAAAAGAPVIAIFGPTMEYKTAPLGGNSISLITTEIPCRPCYTYKPVKCTSFKCLTDITEERIMSEARKILK